MDTPSEKLKQNFHLESWRALSSAKTEGVTVDLKISFFVEDMPWMSCLREIPSSLLIDIPSYHNWRGRWAHEDMDSADQERKEGCQAELVQATGNRRRENEQKDGDSRWYHRQCCDHCVAGKRCRATKRSYVSPTLRAASISEESVMMKSYPSFCTWPATYQGWWSSSTRRYPLWDWFI